MWRPTLPVNTTAGDFSRVRSLVLMSVLSALAVSAGCTQTKASRSSLAAKPAPTVVSARGNRPSETSTPNRKPVQATPITQTWPTELSTSEHSIPARSFDKEGYDLDASYPQERTVQQNALNKLFASNKAVK